jgi:hypothetical protein
MLGSTAAKAQCITLTNNLTCDITVDIAYYDNGMPNCMNNCSTLSNKVISAGDIFNNGCGTCGTLCNIVVTITKIGTTSTSIQADFNNGPQPITNCSGNELKWVGGDSFLVN